MGSDELVFGDRGVGLDQPGGGGGARSSPAQGCGRDERAGQGGITGREFVGGRDELWALSRPATMRRRSEAADVTRCRSNPSWAMSTADTTKEGWPRLRRGSTVLSAKRRTIRARAGLPTRSNQRTCDNTTTPMSRFDPQHAARRRFLRFDDPVAF